MLASLSALSCARGVVRYISYSPTTWAHRHYCRQRRRLVQRAALLSLGWGEVYLWDVKRGMARLRVVVAQVAVETIKMRLIDRPEAL